MSVHWGLGPTLALVTLSLCLTGSCARTLRLVDPPVNSTTKLYSNANATPVLTSLPKPPISTTNAAYSYVSNATYYALTAENDGQAYHEEGTLPTVSSQPEYLAAPNAAPAAGPTEIIEIVEATPAPTPNVGPFLEISAAPISGPASGPAAGPIGGILIGPGIIIAPSTGPAAGPLEGILFDSEIPNPNLANAEAAPDEPADHNIPDTPNPAGQSDKVQDPTTTDQPVPNNPSAGTGNGDDDSLRH